VECLSLPKLVYSAEHCAAIWDMATINSGNNLSAWVAEDSGKVVSLIFASAAGTGDLQVTKTQVVHVSTRLMENDVC